MNFKIVAATLAALTFVVTTSAEARRSSHHKQHETQASSDDDEDSGESRRKSRSSRSRSHDDDGDERHSGLGPRPGAWCGWYMRTRHGGGPEMNLAANWRHWGSPGSPQIGAIVVWPHHVGEIVGQASDGRWIVLSGNDGGQVRRRPRSIAGAAVRT